MELSESAICRRRRGDACRTYRSCRIDAVATCAGALRRGCGQGSKRTRSGPLGGRIYQQHGTAPADDRGEGAALSRRAHRRRRHAAVVAEIFDDRALRSRGRSLPDRCAPRFRPCRRRRWRRMRPPSSRNEARSLLGHARIAAGRADGRRVSGTSSSRRCVARRAATFAGDDDSTRTSTTLGDAPSAAATAATRRASRSRPAARTTCCAIWARGAASVRSPGDRASRTGVAADVPHLHVARALGPHHGVPVLRAGLHSGQPHPHLRRSRRCSRRRCGASRRRRRFPVDFAALRADDRVRASWSRASVRHRRACRSALMLQRHSGDSYGYRFARGRQDGRLFDRLRAQARRRGGNRRASSTSFAMPTW